MFAIGEDQVTIEPNNLLETLPEGPQGSFLGRVTYRASFDHKFSAPELLPPLPRMDPVSEQLIVFRNYDAQIDVWNFGCLIYFMFTGVPPFYQPYQDSLF